MIIALILIACSTLGAAAAALTRANLIHGVLLLIASWAGIAAFYLWAGAEFAAFSQLLVYAGAISMVVLFAVLLTQRGPDGPGLVRARGRSALSLLVAAAVFGALAVAVGSTLLAPASRTGPAGGMQELGRSLLGPQAAALLVIGLVLTVALLGGVVLAAGNSAEREDRP